jgi:pyruvate/2-oxoacid:ferredoxin oxidoreductase alpha subunit
MQREGKSVSAAHLRHLNPFPRNLGEVLSAFETVIIPEMNLGQLCTNDQSEIPGRRGAVLEGEGPPLPDSVRS